MRCSMLLLCTVACGGSEITTTPISAITGDALYVVNGGDDSISVIDTETNTRIGDIRIEGASYPHHAYLSPDRARLAVALPGIDLSGGHSGHAGHTGVVAGVLVIDALTGRAIASRIFDVPNHNAVFDPTGRELWTALGKIEGEVLVLDPTTLETSRTIGVGSGPGEITFSLAGTFAFVANGSSGDVSVIDPSSHTVVQEVAVGEEPVGAWPGRDGVMYVDNEISQTITALDGTSHDVLRTYQLGFTPGYAAVAPNGDLWVTDAFGGRVVIYTAGSDALAGEIATEAGAHAIAFSSDGSRAWVTNQFAASVSVLDVEQRSLIANIPVGDKPNGLVFRSASE